MLVPEDDSRTRVRGREVRRVAALDVVVSDGDVRAHVDRHAILDLGLPVLVHDLVPLNDGFRDGGDPVELDELADRVPGLDVPRLVPGNMDARRRNRADQVDPARLVEGAVADGDRLEALGDHEAAVSAVPGDPVPSRCREPIRHLDEWAVTEVRHDRVRDRHGLARGHADGRRRARRGPVPRVGAALVIVVGPARVRRSGGGGGGSSSWSSR